MTHRAAQVSILKYTDDEYTRYLAVTDWTKPDTDQLMKLVVRFDLNFILIQDRWPEGDAPRTTEQLKDRFYLVQRKLAEARGLGAPPPLVLIGHAASLTPY